MPLRCPLCLTPLPDGARFLRFCTEHPASDGPAATLTYSSADPEKLLRETRCPRGSCPANRSVGVPGVFLAHAGCEVGLDPLVDASGAPLSARDVRAMHPKKGTLEEVGHWQVGLHEMVERRFGSSRPREAFFPAMLLRATGEVPEELGERFGALVGLTGAQSVGKSVLAMQALDAQGYPPGDRARGLGRLSGDYLYCSPEAAGSSAPGATYLQTLRMRKLMGDNRPFHDWVDATPERPRNVKAVFFRPERVAAKQAAPKGAFARELARGWAQVKLIGATLAGLEGKAPPWLHTAVFYDLAGEVSRTAAHERLHQHDAHVDVMTVVLSWEEIAGETPTLGMATSRLREAARWKEARAEPDVRCAVVVTKADLCRRSRPERFSEIEAGPRAGDRALLLRVLEEETRARRDATHGELAGLLSPGGPVDDVFFVWTEGIDTNVPQSYGLEDFVAWCVLRRRPA